MTFSSSCVEEAGCGASIKIPVLKQQLGFVGTLGALTRPVRIKSDGLRRTENYHATE
jgi:hypothetical protein